MPHFDKHMSTLKLTYFDTQGRAEIIRLVLKAVNIKFEDVRISREEWIALKPDTPTGKLPILEYGGYKLTQSLAISRLIAKNHGLMGKDDDEYYLVERAIEQMVDLITLMRDSFHCPEEKKEEMKRQFFDNTGPHHLKVLEGFIRETGFFAGETITLADLYIIVVTDYLVKIPELYNNFPKIKEMRERVLKANTGVDEWVKTRPVVE